MFGGESRDSPRFCIEVNVPREEWKLALLQLHHGATLQSAVEATVRLSFEILATPEVNGYLYEECIWLGQLRVDMSPGLGELLSEGKANHMVVVTDKGG
jgi:hypothetical protein